MLLKAKYKLWDLLLKSKTEAFKIQENQVSIRVHWRKWWEGPPRIQSNLDKVLWIKFLEFVNSIWTRLGLKLVKEANKDWCLEAMKHQGIISDYFSSFYLNQYLNQYLIFPEVANFREHFIYSNYCSN